MVHNPLRVFSTSCKRVFFLIIVNILCLKYMYYVYYVSIHMWRTKLLYMRNFEYWWEMKFLVCSCGLCQLEIEISYENFHVKCFIVFMLDNRIFTFGPVRPFPLSWHQGYNTYVRGDAAGAAGNRHDNMDGPKFFSGNGYGNCFVTWLWTGNLWTCLKFKLDNCLYVDWLCISNLPLCRWPY